MCSHSDKESYKNLCQSDVTVTALIQLRETAAADGGSQTTQYQCLVQSF